MNAPDRSDEVKRIYDDLPPTDVMENGKFPNDDVRRVYLLETLLPELHKIDKSWGYLIKTDQGNKIPSDIIVWKDTMEHFDVLTDTGPAWQPDGVVPNDKWIFGVIDNENDPPVVLPPAPVSISDPIFTEILNKVNENLEVSKAIMSKLEHYDREFKAIQPELEQLIHVITGGAIGKVSGEVAGIDVGGLIGKLFKKK